MVATILTLLGTGEEIALADCTAEVLAGARLYRTPDGRHVAPAFGARAVDLGADPLPDERDEEGLASVVLEWVQAVRAHDWTPLGGQPLDRGGGGWVDLRTAMVRVGWGPDAAQAAWDACLPDRPGGQPFTAAGWAAAGWVVPATSDPAPAFARPVLEARGLMRWGYVTRWQTLPPLPEEPLPIDPEPTPPAGGGGNLGWADILSRFRQDHHTTASLERATELAVTLLTRAGVGPGTPIEAEDEPLPERHVRAACTHPSPLVRAAAWFLLHDEADAWLACTYAECQHHWAVEAEDAAEEGG